MRFLRVLTMLLLTSMLFLCLLLTVSANNLPQRHAATHVALSGGQIHAWVAYAMPGRSGTQIVHVRVLDEAGRGVSGAPVRIMVRDGVSARAYSASTGPTGYARISFPIGQVLSGHTILVHVTAQYRGRTFQTYTRYTPYY
jgi:hypothetical protein